MKSAFQAAKTPHALAIIAQCLIRQLGTPANRGEANILLHDLRPLDEQVFVEQRHEKVDFRLRPFPIFDAEAIKRELTDAEPAAFLNGGADAENAATMALD